MTVVEKIIIKMQAFTSGFNKGMKRAQDGTRMFGTEMGAFGQKFNKSMDGAKAGYTKFNTEMGAFDKGMRKSMPNFQQFNRVAGMGSERFAEFAQTLSPEALAKYGVEMRGVTKAQTANNTISKKSQDLQGSYGSMLNKGKTIQQDYSSMLQNTSSSVKQNSGFYDKNSGKLVTNTGLQKRMTDTLATGGAKAANSLRMFTHGLRGFKMEALGVMFFGMMLAATFRSMLNPALEAYGVMEIWKAMMLVVFQPIVDEIFPVLLGLMTYFMNLPEPVKKAIGAFVVLAYIMSQLLFVIGAFILGIGALTFFWGPLVAGVTLLSALLFPLWVLFIGLKDVFTSSTWSIERFTGVLKILLAVFAIIMIAIKGVIAGPVLLIVAIVYILIELFEFLWKRLPKTTSEGMDLLKTIISIGWGILVDVFTGAGGVIYRVIRFLWDKIKNRFGVGDKTLKEIVEAMKAKLITKFNTLKDRIVTKVTAMKTALVNRFTTLKESVLLKIEEMKTGLSTKFTALKTKFKDWGISIVDNLVAGITSIKDKVIDAILSLFPEWAQDDIKAFGSFTIKAVTETINKIISVFSTGNGNKRDDTGDVSGDVGYGSGTGYPAKSEPEYGSSTAFPEEDDFIWRPGQGAISMNPNDTLVGYKGESPFGGGGETSITNNFYGFTKEDLERELDNRDDKLVNELQRLVKQ